MIAAALTNPLDVVKTRLQTQHLVRQEQLFGPASLNAKGGEIPCPRAPLRYTEPLWVCTSIQRYVVSVLLIIVLHDLSSVHSHSF